MLPDERALDDLVSRAVRRGRTVAAVEGLAWGVACAAVHAALGIAIGIAVLWWRLRRTARHAIVRALDRIADGRNVLVTADELLCGRIGAGAEIRGRVFADASALGRRVDQRAVFPIRRLARALTVAAVAWLLVATIGVWRPPAARAARNLLPARVGRTLVEAVHVTVTIEAPGYTRLPANTIVDPAEVSAVQGSTLRLTIEAPGSDRVTVDHDGATRALSPDATRRAVDRIEPVRSGYYAIATDRGDRRVISIVVSPDALPTVRVTVPGRDLVYSDPNQRVSFDVRARDDFGLTSLTLQYTKVAGSGETFEFREGEVPLAILKPDDRDWRGTAVRSPAELGLEDGDMLVYRAVAADARPGGGEGSSDAFLIEISRLGAGAADGFTVPEQETRYALSQQMLVVKTDRLDRRRGSISEAEFNEAALNLAVEQRMIRAEFVFMLGGEIEDEEVEAAQSTELQEGRLQNRGQRDLREATVSMSQAEKFLAGAGTREALTAERAAIAALQRAFARDRYILRALAGQTRLDPSRRLTGALSQANDWHRSLPRPAGNRRAALLQDLLSGVDGLRPDSPAARFVVLAGEALRIDPDSAALRRIAADLQRIADMTAAPGDAARQRALTDVRAAVQKEATQSLAGPVLNRRFVSPALAGAFNDAIGGRGPR